VIVDPHVHDDASADVVRVTGRVTRLDVRQLGRDLRQRLAGGSRHVVIDLTAASEIAEGDLILGLLALRRDAHRHGGRIVVAVPPRAWERLSRSFALDDLVDVASTLDEALEPRTAIAAAGPSVAPMPGSTTEPAPMRCLQCGTTWYSRVAALIMDAGMSCARCGAPLSAPPHIG
jgi:anti-anti-sigma regulatory factor